MSDFYDFYLISHQSGSPCEDGHEKELETVFECKWIWNERRQHPPWYSFILQGKTTYLKLNVGLLCFGIESRDVCLPTLLHLKSLFPSTCNDSECLTCSGPEIIFIRLLSFKWLNKCRSLLANSSYQHRQRLDFFHGL